MSACTAGRGSRGVTALFQDVRDALRKLAFDRPNNVAELRLAEHLVAKIVIAIIRHPRIFKETKARTLNRWLFMMRLARIVISLGGVQPFFSRLHQHL